MISSLVLFGPAVLALAAAGGHKRIRLESTVKANLPFSDAVWAGDTLYISGQIGLDPSTNKPPATVAEEAQLVLQDFKETVEAAGLTMKDVVQIQIFCSDVSLFSQFNEVYRTFFQQEHYPARAFLGSGKLLFGARFEVQGIAVRS
jgi:2-iminobutanoate/2-iminopropanoate deaminase